jgi:hypothetical protein
MNDNATIYVAQCSAAEVSRPTYRQYIRSSDALTSRNTKYVNIDEMNRPNGCVETARRYCYVHSHHVMYKPCRRSFSPRNAPALPNQPQRKLKMLLAFTLAIHLL